MTIFAEVTENKCIIDRQVHDIDTLSNSLWGLGATYQNVFCIIW